MTMAPNSMKLPDHFRYKGESGSKFLRYRDRVRWYASGIPDEQQYLLAARLVSHLEGTAADYMQQFPPGYPPPYAQPQGLPPPGPPLHYQPAAPPLSHPQQHSPQPQPPPPRQQQQQQELAYGRAPMTIAQDNRYHPYGLTPLLRPASKP